jgi:DNA repair exonuclease SbcCD ATPase subunit
VYYETLILDHWCQHRHLLLEPARGLTGLVGANGSGKTNVLAAMAYLVTGRIPLDGDKASNVHDRIPAKGVSRVVGLFHHKGHKVEVVRGLQRAKSQVRVDGGEATVGEERVGAVLADLIGPPVSLLDDHVFVRKEDMYAFLVATPAKRAEYFQRLFDTRAAAAAYAALGKLPVVTATVTSTETDRLKSQLAGGYEQLADLKTQREAYDDVKGYKRYNDPNAATVELWRRYREARAAAEKAFHEAAGTHPRLVVVLVRLCNAPRVHRASWAGCGLNLCGLSDEVLPEPEAMHRLLTDEMVKYVVDVASAKKAGPETGE